MKFSISFAYIIYEESIMYDKLIEGYIQTLTENDVKDYVVKQGVAITDEEVKTVYQFVKNYAEKEGVSITDGEAKIIFDFLHKNYKALLGPNGIETLKTIKPYLSITLYEEIAKKYITTKNKFF